MARKSEILVEKESSEVAHANCEATPIAAESVHWYDRAGCPVYEVFRADGKGMRPTTLADARKLGLVPSVTMILACAARPGLEAWKARQILESALTLPRLVGETLDDYATRVIEDSKAQGKKAAEKGTELHAAIEKYIRGKVAFDNAHPWIKHCEKVAETLAQYGIDIFKGKPEHSFASPLGYGGKIDWHNDEIVLDFKTKAKVKDVKQLAWPEQCYQLAAYAVGISEPWRSDAKPFHQKRPINVFIGVDDCEVRIHEWTMEDTEQSWRAFEHLFAFWQIQKNWNGK